MSKHTLAPWEIDIDTRPAEICTIYHIPTQPTEDGKGQEWAHIRGPIGYWDADEEENMANARLICAAPDLLEACESLKDICRSLTITSGLSSINGIDIENQLIKAHAAIAKARGE